MLSILFPKYDIDPSLPRVVLYGLTALPFIACLGNLFVGTQRNLPYLAMLIASFCIAFAVERVLHARIGVEAAAVAQTTGTVLFAALLLLATYYYFGHAMGDNKKRGLVVVGRLGFLWVAYISIKLLFV